MLIKIKLWFKGNILINWNIADIAVAVGDHIQFLDVNGSILGNVSDGMQEVSGLGYNAELRRLYFADNERLHGSVFELTLPKVLGEEQEEGRAHAIVASEFALYICLQ